MKISESLETVATPEDEANEIRVEFQAILNEAGVTVDELEVLPERAIKSSGKTARTSIYGFVIPKMENGEYDAEKVDVALRKAHRLISEWLAQKEADGQLVDVDQHSDVGGGRKFSTRLYPVFLTKSTYIKVPSIHLTVTIGNKVDASAAN
jgi:hypothetical protein